MKNDPAALRRCGQELWPITTRELAMALLANALPYARYGDQNRSVRLMALALGSVAAGSLLEQAT